MRFDSSGGRQTDAIKSRQLFNRRFKWSLITSTNGSNLFARFILLTLISLLLTPDNNRSLTQQLGAVNSSKNHNQLTIASAHHHSAAQHSLRAALDEEIPLNDQLTYDYEKTSAANEHEQPTAAQAQPSHHHHHHQHHKQQQTHPADHDSKINTKLNAALNQSSKRQELLSGNNDPFAVTFEDYVMEASKSFAQPFGDDSADSSFAANNRQQSSSVTAIPDEIDLVEDDLNGEHDLEHEEEKRARNSVVSERTQTKLVNTPVSSESIDYIFPAPRQKTNNEHTQTAADLRKNPGRKATTELEKSVAGSLETNGQELVNEIKLLFAWRTAPSNKCSKTCGKGFRMNRFSCIDLKYNVKVENELCQKANLPKPNETSNEPCNEIDCEAQWMSVEFPGCDASTSLDGTCLESSVFERVLCTMVNKSGALIYLEDSKCDGSNPLSMNIALLNKNKDELHQSTEQKPEQITTTTTKPQSSQPIDDVVSLDELAKEEGSEKNDIMADELETDLANKRNQKHPLSDQLIIKSHKNRHHNNQPHNEPFFELGAWSECIGAPCGQLGKRTRDVSCRMFLSRSAKLVELPESSCHETQTPHSEEPCYMDCTPNNVDYIFPVEQQKKEKSHRTYNGLKLNLNGGSWSNKQRGSTPENQLIKVSVEKYNNNDEQLLNDIKFLFAWKDLPTSKCSKQCGRGFKLNRLYCIDLKYNVRVEEELCQKSVAPKPNETSSEPCNEIDCPPQWLTVEFQGCSPGVAQNGECQPHLYKRVQCTMINREGALVYLDDVHCTSSTNSHLAVSDALSVEQELTNSNSDSQKTQNKPLSEFNQAIDDIVDLDELANENKKNDILSNIEDKSRDNRRSEPIVGLQELLQTKISHLNHHPHNEPFFQPGPWSQCAGALCGELGKRVRDLSCRIYLSKSSKFIELPITSCHNAQALDREEPCYMDCNHATSTNREEAKKAKKRFCMRD